MGWRWFEDCEDQAYGCDLLAMIMMVEIVVQGVQLVELLEVQQAVLHHVKIVSLIGLHMDLSVVIQHGMSMELTVQH